MNEAKQKAIAMLEADLEAAKPFLRSLAERFGACKGIFKAIDQATKEDDIYEIFRKHHVELSEHFGDRVTWDDVMEWIEKHDLSYTRSEWIFPHLNIDLDAFMDENYNPFRDSLLNTMKFELFMELVDDLQLADLEALHAKYRPNSIEAVNQMRMVV